MNARDDLVGKWSSAALDDPAVCAEMKADITAWMNSGEPKYVEGMGDPLSMLAEECAEVIVEIMKCQRFGLGGTKAWVDAGNDPPRLRMVQELADVAEVAKILCDRGVFTEDEFNDARMKKRDRLKELFG